MREPEGEGGPRVPTSNFDLDGLAPRSESEILKRNQTSRLHLKQYNIRYTYIETDNGEHLKKFESLRLFEGKKGGVP